MSLTTVKKLQYLKTLTPDFYKFLNLKKNIFQKWYEVLSNDDTNRFGNMLTAEHFVNRFLEESKTIDLIEFQPTESDYLNWKKAKIELENAKNKIVVKEDDDWEDDDWEKETDDALSLERFEQDEQKEYKKLLDLYENFLIFDKEKDTKDLFDIVRCDENQFDVITKLIKENNPNFKYTKVIICHHSGDFKKNFEILDTVPLYFFVGKKINNDTECNIEHIILNDNSRFKSNIYIKVSKFDLENSSAPGIIEKFLRHKRGNEYVKWEGTGGYSIFYNKIDKKDDLTVTFCKEEADAKRYINYNIVDIKTPVDAKIIEYGNRGFKNIIHKAGKNIFSVNVKPGDRINYIPNTDNNRIFYIHGSVFTTNISSSENFITFKSDNANNLQKELEKTTFIFSDMTRADLKMVMDLSAIKNVFTREDFNKDMKDVIMFHDYKKFLGVERKTALEIEYGDNLELNQIEITQLEDFLSRLVLKNRHFGSFGNSILNAFNKSNQHITNSSLLNQVKRINDDIAQKFNSKTPEEKFEIIKKVERDFRLKNSRIYIEYPFSQEVIRVTSEENYFYNLLMEEKLQTGIDDFFYDQTIVFEFNKTLDHSVLISNKKVLYLDMSNFDITKQNSKKIYVKDIDLLVIYTNAEKDIGDDIDMPIINISGKIHSLVSTGGVKLIFDNVSPKDLSIISGDFDKFIEYPDNFEIEPASKYSISFFISKGNNTNPLFIYNIHEILDTNFSYLPGCKKLRNFNDYPKERTIIKNLYVKPEYKEKRWNSTLIQNPNREKI